MRKIRINKLALELNIQNDQILDALTKKGYTVKNYMSSVDAVIANEIRELFAPKPSPTKKTTPKAKTKTTKKVPLKKETPEKKPPKTKIKTSKIKKATAKKAAITRNKVKIEKTKKKSLVKDSPDEKPEKIIKKTGLKIVKHEGKPKETEKKPSAAKDKPKARPVKPVKKEKASPEKIPEPAQPQNPVDRLLSTQLQSLGFG